MPFNKAVECLIIKNIVHLYLYEISSEKREIMILKGGRIHYVYNLEDKILHIGCLS